MIVDDNVTSADIRDTTIVTANIKDTAVTAPKLNQMGAGLNQVIKWTGSVWAPRNDSTVPSGDAGGDLSGSYPGPTVKTGAIDSMKIADNAVPLSRIVGGAAGKAVVAQGLGSDPQWGYPSAVGDSLPTTMKFLKFDTVTVQFPTTSGPAFCTTTATIPGARVGDLVHLFSSASFDPEFILCATCAVTATNTITVRAYRPTGSGQPLADIMRYIWIRP
jgi:hypothetical protein